jgi:uncharacterized protein
LAEKNYLDVNILIYWIMKHPEFGEKALNWIIQAEDSPGAYITSALSIYESAFIIAGLHGKTLNDQSLMEEITSSFSDLKGIHFAPLTFEQLTEAPNLMTQYNLDLEDAVHLTVALENNASRIISNDKDFDRVPISRIF